MISAILLAAGKSARFGSDKLTHHLDDKMMIEHCLAYLQDITDELYVVVNTKDSQLKKILAKTRINLVECPDAHLGMSATIKCGISATSHADGWIITLADMPYIQASTIQKIHHSLSSGKDIVAPYYKGRRGNPVGFSKHHLDALLKLTGDKGARDLLKSQIDKIFKIDVDDPGILIDIDTKDELNNI